MWLAEGLLMYLEEAAVAVLLEETAGAPYDVTVVYGVRPHISRSS